MFNKVILIGNVGREPDIRVLESGVKMARFSLATNEEYLTSDKGRMVHTEWHNIVAWRSDASYVEANVKVGSKLYVEGRIRSRQAVDLRSKTSTCVYEIVATSVRLTDEAYLEPKINSSDSDKLDFAPQCDPDGIPF